jgi:MFS transporter, DHA1 family, inner membrane transport protein
MKQDTVLTANPRADTRHAQVSPPTGLIELALAVGGFGIGTGEFAIMGLLPNVAESFHVSAPEAGHVISAYALGVVVGSPIIAVVASKLSRRTLLLSLMAVFTFGNLSSALASGYLPLVLIRFLTGVPHGAYFGVASLVAAALAPPNKRAQAVGRMMLGLTVATLVGTPLATWFGQSFGWRMAFAAVGLIGALTVGLIYAWVPGTGERASSPLVELGALKRKQVWLTLGIAAVGSGGMFAIFTYIAPTLTQISGVPPVFVPFVLCIFGAGMILGNIVGGKLADLALIPTIGGTLLWNGAVAVLFVMAAHNPWTAALAILLLGCGFAIVPGLQTRLMDVAADAQTLAAALNHSAFNIANALGAWLGGVTIAAGYGWTSTGWVGALLSIGGLVIFGISILTESETAPTKLRRLLFHEVPS